MTRSFSRLNILSVVAFKAMAGTALLVAFEGPTTPIPVHFDLAGDVDSWGTRLQVGVGMLALAAIGLSIALFIGREAGRHEAGSSRRRGLAAAQTVVVVTFALVTALFAGLAFMTNGAEVPKGGLMAGLGLLLACSGAVLGRVAPNPFVGVRTPWAYKSRLSWDRSNRLAGRLFFFGGLAAIVAAPFSPQPLGMVALISGVIIAALWSIVESWRVWRADPNPQPF